MSHIYPEASVHISKIIYFRKFSYPTVLVQNVEKNIFFLNPFWDNLPFKNNAHERTLKMYKNKIFTCTHVHIVLHIQRHASEVLLKTEV